MNQETPQGPASDEAPDTPLAERSVDAAAAEPVVERPARPVFALLALVIALLAAALAAYAWKAQQGAGDLAAVIARLETATEADNTRIDALNQRLEALAGRDEGRAASVGKLEARLTEQAAQIAEQAAQIERQRARLAEQARELEGLPPRLERLRRSIEDMPGIAEDARAAWLVAEAEYFLEVANAQLELARNPGVAIEALEIADEKLRDTGDPGLTPVRRAIADEIAALRAVPRPDTAGLALELGSLARRIPELPLPADAPTAYRAGNDAATDASGFARAWRVIRDAFAGLVRVRRTEASEIEPLRSAAEIALLQRTLQTELAIARLALIRGEAELYREAVESVRARVARQFDADAPPVTAALAQLDELAGVRLPEALPDVSRSLKLLRRRAAAGSGSAAPPDAGGADRSTPAPRAAEPGAADPNADGAEGAAPGGEAAAPSDPGPASREPAGQGTTT